MARNLSQRIDPSKNLEHIMNGFISARIEMENGLQYEKIYGDYGMFFSRYVTPYFWIFPLLATGFLWFTFKRNALFGPMQKYLITIMIIDVFLTMITGFKDAIFNIMNWNYGFIEYRVCWILLSIYRFQYIIHATSLWIKSVMFVHRVFMFLFPFKMRQWNLKLMVVPYIIFHLVVSTLFGAIFMLTPIKRLPLLQVYKRGIPLKKIEACFILQTNEYLSETMYRIVYWFSFFLQNIYFSVLPIFIHVLCTFFIICLVRREIERVANLSPNGRKKVSKNVKYLVLIKVHILLGISFMCQEVPLYASQILAETDQMGKVAHTASGISTIIMYVAFAFGKPIEVMIYASLSKKVKEDLRKIIRCRD